MASSSLVSPLPPVSPSSLQASSRDYFSMVTRASTTQQQQQHHSLPLETPYYTPMPFPQTPFFSGSSSSSSSASPNTTTGIRTTTTTTLLTPAAHQPPPGTLNLTNTPSLSSTSSTPAAPTETMAEFTPDQLAQLLVAQQKQQQQKLLILDMRMYNQYSSSRITSAVNVCIPTTLLKRPALKPDKLFDTLGSDHAKSILKDWSTADLLVLYDDSTFLGPLSPLSLLSKKLLLSSSASGPRVAWLKGGFTAFQQSHPSLCESSVQGGPTSGSGGGGLAARKGLGMTLNLGGNGNNATTAQSKQRPPIGAGGGIRAMSFTDVSSGSGPLTAPSALGAISSFRPLTRPAYASHTSVSAADSSQSDDSDTHMFRDLLPLDQSNNRHIPRFLRDLFTTPDIKGAIEANFSTVESAERKRLECAFRAMSATDPFSVSDALEAGATRNRYNNIWPFNHNRVRLHVDSSDMDTTTSTEVLSPTPTTTTKCFQGAAVPMARSGSAVIPASSAPPLPSHIKPLKSSVQQRPTSLFDASHSIPPIIPLTNTSSSTITVPGADYINASHILSPAGHRNYIATQGPIPSTFADFWRMTYEQKSQVILMLCADADVQRGSQTCHTYWPDTETTYESITVTKVKEVRVPWKDSVPDQGGCILRLFRLSQGKQPPLETWQIQYLGWPDHGVPSHPDEMLRVHYLLSTLLSRLPEPSPVIVHCSAGVGRTGAFICVDAVLALLTSLPSTSPIPNPFPPSSPTTTSTSWSTVNPILTPSTFTAETPHDMVLAATHHLRSQRVLMVQSLSQFGYCYQVIGRWCALQSLPTTTSASYKETVGTEGVDLVLGEVCPPREEAALLGKRERVGSLDTVQVGGKRS